MITKPNTDNQIRFEDVEGDIAMVDLEPGGAVIVTTFNHLTGEYGSVFLTNGERIALIRHLIRRGRP